MSDSSSQIETLLSKFSTASAALHEETNADTFIERITIIVKSMQEYCQLTLSNNTNPALETVLQTSTSEILDHTKSLLIVAKSITHPSPNGNTWNIDNKSTHSELIKNALFQLVMSVKLMIHKQKEPLSQQRPIVTRQGSAPNHTQSLLMSSVSTSPSSSASSASSSPSHNLAIDSRKRGLSNSVFYVDTPSSPLPSSPVPLASTSKSSSTSSLLASSPSSSSSSFPFTSPTTSSTTTSTSTSTSTATTATATTTTIPPTEKRGKSVKELVQELIPSGESTIDSSNSSSVIDTYYVEDFLLTFRQFLSPGQLIDELIVRVLECKNLNAQRAFSIKLRVVRVMKKWTEQFGEDFIDIPLLKKAFHLLDDLLNDEKLASAVATIHATIKATLNEYSTKRKAEEASGKTVKDLLSNDPNQSGAKPAKQVIREISTKNDNSDLSGETAKLLGLSKDPVKFTQQICLLDKQLFCQIRPRDFLAQYNGLSVASIDTFIDWFNNLSQWVATTVCVASSFEERVGVIERWLELARQALAVSNYNFLMAIVSGLNMSPVQRLKRSWNEVSKKYIAVREEAEQILDPANNYKKYRAVLAAKMSDIVPLKIIPFIALYLKDFFFMNDGNPSLFGEGLVNYDKFELIAGKMREIRRCQMSDFTGFTPIPEIQTALKGIQVYSETKLYQLSLICEPRSSISVESGTIGRKEGEESAFAKLSKKLTLKKGDSKVITTML